MAPLVEVAGGRGGGGCLPFPWDSPLPVGYPLTHTVDPRYGCVTYKESEGE